MMKKPKSLDFSNQFSSPTGKGLYRVRHKNMGSFYLMTTSKHWRMYLYYMQRLTP